MFMSRYFAVMLASAATVLAQSQTCIPLATSTTCSAFNASSISTDTFMVGLYPFLQGVTDAASFDRNLTAYVQNGYVQLKYQTLFGCGGISLTNTSNLYARFTTTVICNGVIQNSVDRCGLTASNSRPVCVDTCGKYALSEQKILANSQLCTNPSNYNLTQLRADYTNCGLPNTALDASSCVDGTTNEPTNCGFGYATVGLCQYCTSGGENPTDPCCTRAQASTRCANVVLPSLASTSASFLTATSMPTSTSTSPLASSSTGANVASFSNNSNSNSSLSGGAIAGIAIGGTVALALVVLALLFCCRIHPRRKRAAAAKQKSRDDIHDPTRAMVFVPGDSNLGSHSQATSYFGRSPSGSEGSDSRPITSSRVSEPSTSAYIHPAPVTLSYSTENSIEPSLDIKARTQRSESGHEIGIAEVVPVSAGLTRPSGKAATHARSSIIPQDRTPHNGLDFIVLPGGRKARISLSSDRPLSSRSIASDHDIDERTSNSPFNSTSRRTAARHHSRTGTATSAMKSTEEFEVLPGGRVARRSGIAGHVGGIDNWNALTTPGRIDHSVTEKEPITSTQNTSDSDGKMNQRIPDKDTHVSAAPITVPEAELISIPTPIRGPTMPPNSSAKDYYTIKHLSVDDKVKAVWSYAAKNKDEFTLERGDVLIITSIWADGWATGHVIKESENVAASSSEVEQNNENSAPVTEPIETVEQAETTKDGKIETETRETKAFPLICVCAYEYWSRVIEANGKPLATHSFDLI